MEVTWPQVLAWRLRRQHLDPRTEAGAVELARRLCGIQAQVASSAEQAVAVRRVTAQSGECSIALAERQLVKTWAMRGTLHLLPPDEAGAYLALVAARRTWEAGAWQKAFGQTPDQVQAMVDAAAEILDGRTITREELINELMARLAEFRGAGPDLAAALRSGWSALLKPLAWQGVLCQGDAQGSRVTFTRPDSWSPSWRGLPDVEEAARLAISAYLGAYGPATPDAFDSWLTRGASRKADLRRWFEAVADDIVTVTVTDAANESADASAESPPAAYMLAEHLDDLLATEPSDVVRLLPGFDQYVLGPGTGATAVIPAAHRALVSRKAGWISPVVVHGGRVAGVWEPGEKRAEIRLWSDVPADLLAAEVARWSTYLGRDLEPQVSRL